MKGVLHNILLILAGIVLYASAYSQELEPRALSNLPVGTNFIVAGYGYAGGNILLDPALPLEDLDAKMHTFIAAYVRSFNFFGMSAKFDAVLPYATGDWYYKYQGNNEYDLSNGFADARFRFSFNFMGAPALIKNDFKEYKQKTIAGYSLQVVAPTGNYKTNQLPNLGSNRWAFKNQFGISQAINKWIIEGYAALWIFTKNPDFLNGNTLKQDPLATFKLHIIRSLPKSFWISFGVGYGYGGKSYINGEPREAVISTMRLGLIVAIPIKSNHSLKLSGLSGIRFKQGSDFDAVSLSYQFRWNRK